jgi:hypothetical protein
MDLILTFITYIVDYMRIMRLSICLLCVSLSFCEFVYASANDMDGFGELNRSTRQRFLEREISPSVDEACERCTSVFLTGVILTTVVAMVSWAWSLEYTGYSAEHALFIKAGVSLGVIFVSWATLAQIYSNEFPVKKRASPPPKPTYAAPAA